MIKREEVEALLAEVLANPTEGTAYLIEKFGPAPEADSGGDRG